MLQCCNANKLISFQFLHNNTTVYSTKTAQYYIQDNSILITKLKTNFIL